MTLDLSPDHFCEPICEVSKYCRYMLAMWATDNHPSWIIQPDKERKPQRLLEIPDKLIVSFTSTVFAAMGGNLVAHEIVLSRMMPGQVHGMHQDQQPNGWVTRVHVPIVTNEKAWHTFEDTAVLDQGGYVNTIHMRVGRAYTFNAQRRHAFGNAGTTPRVHLIFDVLRR